ncbi:hypothetical protein CQA66_01915 [Helicobacter aurati]|uniref:Rod shape-determining protein MreD n=1 Tax=Helicobacter aurati TaxID=137778 RepID=A0A3D8J9B2_9HELI|nr:hypothetical protein [Helicobacter aurati]RDU73441.1 hypothetical protein CQA66_01915 [Helicobacter aurati]
MYKQARTTSLIIHILFVGFYIIYSSMSDIYQFLPPLLGILFVIFHKHSNDEQLFVSLLVFLCLTFYELHKSLTFGIMPIVFCITYFFIAKRLEALFSNNFLFMILYTAAIYLIYYAGTILCNVLFGIPALRLSSLFAYYLIIDCALALAYNYFIVKE